VYDRAQTIEDNGFGRRGYKGQGGRRCQKVDISHDGREFELQTCNGIPLDIINEFIDEVDAARIPCQARRSYGEWPQARENGSQDRITGSAVDRDGKILGEYGTWRKDRAGNLYVGGITQEEAVIFASEGGIVDPYAFDIGKTGRETTYFHK